MFSCPKISQKHIFIDSVYDPHSALQSLFRLYMQSIKVQQHVGDNNKETNKQRFVDKRKLETCFATAPIYADSKFVWELILVKSSQSQQFHIPELLQNHLGFSL